MSFGGGAPAPDTRARDILNQITTEQRGMYNSIYKPVQTRLQARLNNPNYENNLANKSVAYVQRAGLNGAGIAQRTQQRFGMRPTARQQQALNTQQALGNATSTTDALNNTRQAAYGLKTAGLNALTGINASQAGGIRRNAGAMARLEAGRNSKNQQIAAQDQAGTMQAIGTAAGIGAAIFA